ncbi:MAG: hypothetical protein L3J79_12985, partial [Candidatus Marinimicrobia bacterium]|nr:hypothetical protein [Candidatus Neomarinimicrobiota bacterium]
MRRYKFTGRSKNAIVTITTASILIATLSTIVLAAVLATDDRPVWNLGGGEGTHITVGKPSRTSFGEVRIYHDSSIDPLITIPASEAQDGFGIFTSAIGDLDDDGFDDLVVGAPFNSSFASSSGSVFVFSSVTGQSLLEIQGDGPFVELGRAVSGAGDLNGDGIPEVIACGFEFNEFAEPMGTVRIYSGAAGSLLRIIYSTETGNGFGFTISPLPDIDNDGYGEIAVGAPIEDLNKANGAIGRVYVFSGASLADGVIEEPQSSALYTIENDDPDLRYFGVVIAHDDDATDENALLIGGVDPESLGPSADILFYLSSYGLDSGVLSPVVTAPPKIIGDVTGDGIVDNTDVQLVMSMLGTVSGNEPFSGDANGSGIVLSDDVAMVISSVGTTSPIVDLVPNAAPILSRIFELTSPAVISGTAVSDGSYNFLKDACILGNPRALGGDCDGDDTADSTDADDSTDTDDATDEDDGVEGIEGGIDILESVDGLDVTDSGDAIDATDMLDGLETGGVGNDTGTDGTDG